MASALVMSKTRLSVGLVNKFLDVPCFQGSLMRIKSRVPPPCSPDLRATITAGWWTKAATSPELGSFRFAGFSSAAKHAN